MKSFCSCQIGEELEKAKEKGHHVYRYGLQIN